MENSLEENYNPYCPVCSGCGEEGCCSPLMCKQSPDGSYCESYLRELRMGYHLHQWFEQTIYGELTQEQKDRFDKKWDELYDLYHPNIIK